MKSQKQTRKLRLGSVAAQCLLEIAYSTELFLENMHRPYLAFRHGLEDATEIRELHKQRTRRRELRRLEERRLIKLQKVGDKCMAALTEAGVAEALRLEVANAEPLPEGVRCLVVFDVPVEFHRLRKQLRRFLKWAGFRKVQQSVWSSSKDACYALASLFSLKKFEKWVRIYRGSEVLIQ